MVQDKITVVKIGGSVVDDRLALQSFIKSFAALEGHLVLVHGGGKQATSLAARLQIPQQMIDGRRVTDEATLSLVTMVYAGLNNKRLVALLQAHDVNAIGLSGPDANIIRAQKRRHPTIDYGYAGDIKQVDALQLMRLLQQGLTPVIAPITHDGAGQLLNTNADSVAAAVATGLAPLGAVQLIYCFEKAGVLKSTEDETSVIDILRPEDMEAMRLSGLIHTGMLPKLEQAFDARQKGVHKVSIGKASELAGLVHQIKGTSIL
jgi:acetylglutamate kinase